MKHMDALIDTNMVLQMDTLIQKIDRRIVIKEDRESERKIDR